MKEILLCKCGELVLKGLNRHKFEDRLRRTLYWRLKKLGEFRIHGCQSTIYVEPLDPAISMDETVEVCRRVFGIVAISRAAVCEKDIDDICKKAGEYLAPLLRETRTFKVETRRSDKQFPLTSPQISGEVGGYLSDLFPHLKPQMDAPQVTVKVEVREEYAFVSGGVIPGAGGLPTGTSGRGMLLLSGGIDSPAAGWMMAKRGLELGAVHFFSYPYTSMEAKQKVLDLAAVLAQWSGKLTVSVVPFTHIQNEIRSHCREDYFTLVMRRFMMRIAQRVAKRCGAKALVTGESLGQVASQTMDALAVSGDVTDLPVLRPVIGMDKEEIVRIARHIGTFETSILPYEDCCTVFTPRHPKTRPHVEEVREMEQALDVEGLVRRAMEGREVVKLR